MTRTLTDAEAKVWRHKHGWFYVGLKTCYFLCQSDGPGKVSRVYDVPTVLLRRALRVMGRQTRRQKQKTEKKTTPGEKEAKP